MQSYKKSAKVIDPSYNHELDPPEGLSAAQKEHWADLMNGFTSRAGKVPLVKAVVMELINTPNQAQRIISERRRIVIHESGCLMAKSNLLTDMDSSVLLQLLSSPPEEIDILIETTRNLRGGRVQNLTIAEVKAMQDAARAASIHEEDRPADGIYFENMGEVEEDSGFDLNVL